MIFKQILFCEICVSVISKTTGNMRAGDGKPTDVEHGYFHTFKQCEPRIDCQHVTEVENKHSSSLTESDRKLLMQACVKITQQPSSTFWQNCKLLVFGEKFKAGFVAGRGDSVVIVAHPVKAAAEAPPHGVQNPRYPGAAARPDAPPPSSRFGWASIGKFFNDRLFGSAKGSDVDLSYFHMNIDCDSYIDGSDVESIIRKHSTQLSQTDKQLLVKARTKVTERPRSFWANAELMVFGEQAKVRWFAGTPQSSVIVAPTVADHMTQGGRVVHPQADHMSQEQPPRRVEVSPMEPIPSGPQPETYHQNQAMDQEPSEQQGQAAARVPTPIEAAQTDQPSGPDTNEQTGQRSDPEITKEHEPTHRQADPFGKWDEF